HYHLPHTSPTRRSSDLHYWPNQDPIGKRLKPGATTSNTPWRTVIGVVKDVRQNDFIAEPKMQMYFSYKQVEQLVANALIVRTSRSEEHTSELQSPDQLV